MSAERARPARWTVTRRVERELVDQLLRNRGIVDRERFFAPDYLRDSHDPFLLPNMSTAVDRILAAIAAKELLAVYTDYDADGVPGGALLMKMLTALGAPIVPYVPDREREGYGLHVPAINALKAKGVSLIITVDLGVTNDEQVAHAHSLGIDVIVTDHHHVDPTRIPTAAIAVVHPALPESAYPFAGLAGGGVAWKLVQALQARTGTPSEAQLKWWLELPAISTVCDIVPLVDENRMIVHYGLKVLMQTRNVGLRALYRTAGIDVDVLNEGTIGFQIGPRINAPGRMEHATGALKLLLSDQADEAAALAAQIEEQNRDRQTALEQIVAEVVARVEEDGLADAPAIVLLGDDWPVGLIGLAASRVVERFYRPTILLGRSGDEAKGSGRSIDGFDLLAGIDAQKALLTGYGGHTKAAGLHLPVANVEAFAAGFRAFAVERLSADQLVRTLRADAIISPAEVTDELVTTVLRFAPFGQANPRPKFIIQPLTVAAIKTVGTGGRHLKVRFVEGDLDAIGFGIGSLATHIRVGDAVAAFASLEFNSWNGVVRTQLKLEDLRPCGTGDIATELA
ncbi:MAG: single-stranded-DNA-specific exonuclease RecJ [Patescibacteria group bacterium]